MMEMIDVVGEFGSFLRSLGLVPGPIVADGQVRRCRTEDKPRRRNGAYMLAPDQRFGWAQNHATMQAPAVWKADGPESALPPPPDPEAERRRRAQERRSRAEATRKARAFYEGAQELRGGHPYLESHGLGMDGCTGLRVDDDGWLVVPAMRGGSLLSVQRIAPDGEKRFWPGASMRGVWYEVGRPQASITVLAEGLATGLAIFAAAPLVRVVVAFTAGNMARVAESYPFRGMVAVAADNDHRTYCGVHADRGTAWPLPAGECGATKEVPRRECNPGVRRALEAAGLIGCGVMVPEGISGTDWSDWREERTEARLEARPYGSHQTDGAVRRAVDAEIQMEVQRRARFVALKSLANADSL